MCFWRCCDEPANCPVTKLPWHSSAWKGNTFTRTIDFMPQRGSVDLAFLFPNLNCLLKCLLWIKTERNEISFSFHTQPPRSLTTTYLAGIHFALPYSRPADISTHFPNMFTFVQWNVCIQILHAHAHAYTHTRTNKQTTWGCNNVHYVARK